MQRIRKGDEVLVIAGKDKGKKGVVIARVDETHVTVEGVNVVKKCVRPDDEYRRRYCRQDDAD